MRLTPTKAELSALCEFLDRHITVPDKPGEHCDATPRYAREYLANIGRLSDLDDYLEAAIATCDCTILLNFPGIFAEEGATA